MHQFSAFVAENREYGRIRREWGNPTGNVASAIEVRGYKDDNVYFREIWHMMAASGTEQPEIVKRTRMFFLNNIPNIISASRGIAALVMLLYPAFSDPFWMFYCWCGFSDMIDGALARKMNVTGELGSRIDSVADLVFVICSVISILPSVDLPVWIWLWTASVGLVKASGIIIGSCRQRKLTIPHSVANKLTGILLFCLPFAIVRFNVLIPSEIVCIMATISLVEDFQIIRI